MKKSEVIFSSLFSVCTFLFGNIDSLMITLLLVMGLDYITGIIKAILKKKLNSTLGIKGIFKKVGYLLIIILVTHLDNVFVDSNQALRTLVIYFFFSNESISILENWAIIGLPLPNKLYQALEKLKNDE